MSLSLFRPLNTLERYDSLRQLPTQADTIESLTTLSQLDVNSLNDNEILNVSDFWCKIIMLVKFGFSVTKIELTDHILIAIINSAETAILLHLRLLAANYPSLEPILCFLGLSDNIFNDCEAPEKYPIRLIKSTESHFTLISFFKNRFENESKLNINEIFTLAIGIASKAHNIQNTDPSYDYVFTAINSFNDITQEMLNVEDLSSVIEKVRGFPTFSYLIILFLYEYLFNSIVPSPFTIPNFFTRLIPFFENAEKASNYSSLLILTTSEPILYTDKLLSLPLFGLIFRKGLIIDENVLFNFTPETKFEQLLIYALYINIDHPVMEKFFSQAFPENAKEFIESSKNKLGLSESVETLIKKATEGNAESAKRLYNLKVPASQLTDEKSPLQNILRILQSDNVEINDPSNVDDFTQIKLIRLFQLGRPPPLEFVTEILKNLHKKLMEATPKDTFDIIMCNCTAYDFKSQTYDIPLPLTIEDFIMDLPFKPFIAYSQLVYLTVVAYDIISTNNEELLNLYVDFSLHLYLNYVNNSHLRNFLLQEMPSIFEEKRNKARMQHAVRAIEITPLEHRIETLKSLNPILNDTEIFEVTQFLINSGDNKSLAAFFKMSPSAASTIAPKFDKEKQFKLFEVLFEHDMSSISIEYARLLLNNEDRKETKEKLIQILCKNALEHPKTVAQVFLAPSLNMSVEDTGNLLTNLPHFSNEISLGFTQMLSKLLSLLPVHLLLLKKLPPEKPQISSQWEDDLQQETKKLSQKENDGSNEEVPDSRQANDRKFVDIWRYPDQPEKCQKDSPNSHHYFYCYTCGIHGSSYICQHCAELCHFGHDIVLASTTENHACCCGSHCIANRPILPPFPEIQKTDTEINIEKKESCVSDSVLLNLFLNLASSKLAQKKNSDETAIESLFGSKQLLSEVSLSSFDRSSLLSASPFRLKPITDSPKFVNISDLINLLSSREPITHLIRRSSVVPLHLMELAGPASNILVICNGKKLISYSITQTSKSSNNTENNNSNNENNNNNNNNENNNNNNNDNNNNNENNNNNNNDNNNNNNANNDNAEMEADSPLEITDGSCLKQLHQFQIDNIGLQLCVCPIDPSVFAVVSTHHVSIFSVDSSGSFRNVTEIELMLEELGTHIFVDSVFWVPNQLMHLAVVCNAFIKIYDVPQDCFSPVAYYVPPQDCFFTSVATSSIDEDTAIILFGISNGKIAIREIKGKVNDTSPTGVSVNRFIETKKRIPQYPIISLSEENDIIFVSSQTTQTMLIMKLSQVIEVMVSRQPSPSESNSNNNNSKVIDTYDVQLGEVKNTGALSLIGSIATTNFFEHPSSGSVMSINFNTETCSFEVSFMNKNVPSCPIPLFEGQMSTLSTLINNNKLYAISPINGKLMRLTSANSMESDDDEVDENDSPNDSNNNNSDDYNENIVFSDDDDDEDENDDDRNYNDDGNRPVINENIQVPPWFWTLSKVSTNDISIVESKNNKDIHQLLSGSRYIFDESLKHKSLLIQSTNANQLVVGFRVSLGSSASYHRPPWVKINGRKQSVNSMRFFMLPLKPGEVKSKAINKIEFGSNNGYDINCDRIDVFVIDKSMFPKEYLYLTVKSYDWLNLGTSLFDYIDSKVSKKKRLYQFNDRIINLMNLCTQAIAGEDQQNSNNNDSKSSESEVMSEVQLRKVIRLMYFNPKASDMCRRLIVKCVRNRDDAIKIWADEIVQTVQQKQVAEESWSLIWRDISLLPQELMQATSNKLWESDYVLDGPCSVISAFMSK